MKAAVSMLKQEYKEQEVDLQAGLELAIKVLSKTLDTNKLTPEKGIVNINMEDVNSIKLSVLYEYFTFVV